MRVEVKGLSEVAKKLQQLAKQMPGAYGAALYQEGMTLWRNSVKRAPVEYGVLRTSGYVSPPLISNGRIYVEAGFGTKYAVYQHEMKDLKHPRGGEAGYLRHAAEQLMSGFLERMGKRTWENFVRGVSTPAVQAPPRPKDTSSSRLKKARKGRKR